jgi:hypothetical protein
MYNTAGELVPIEINTNVGLDRNKLEEPEGVFDLTDLTTFITTNNFTKVTYIGTLQNLNLKLKTICDSLGIDFYSFSINGRNSIPDIGDTPEHLIIRSSFDPTAILDTTYCRNKVNFLNLIKGQSFGSEFAYMDENNVLVSNITTIRDNGDNPNFILKAVYPSYDKDEFPKFYKVSTSEELNVILQNVNTNYFLMVFHYNKNKLYENHIQLYRSMNLLFPPDLESIKIGHYTKLTTMDIDGLSTYDPTTFQLMGDSRKKYLTSDKGVNSPKLLDTDRVEMSDGTFKTALELEVGDMVKTIIIPNLNNVNLSKETANFNIDYLTFISGTTYSSNKILFKNRVNELVDYVTLTFTDGTTWEDTKLSSYLIVRDNNVRFVFLSDEFKEKGIKIGDKLILLNTTSPTFEPITKEISNITTTKQIFGGWIIGVEEQHVFLTQNEENLTFVSIEHNTTCSYYENYNCVDQYGCAKGEYCCEGTCYSFSTSHNLYMYHGMFNGDTFQVDVDGSTVLYETTPNPYGPITVFNGSTIFAQININNGSYPGGIYFYSESPNVNIYDTGYGWTMDYSISVESWMGDIWVSSYA